MKTVSAIKLINTSDPIYNKLKVALKEQYSPFKPSSREIHTPPKDCIKRAFKRLKDQCDFGIPDKLSDSTS